MGKNSLNFTAVLKSGPWLHSPHLPAWQKALLKNLRDRIPKTKDLFWILSSGTSSVNEVKAIGIRKEAILASAAAVNRHLQSTRADRWLLNLPVYHVGGLGILARADLSGAKVHRQVKWSAEIFTREVLENKISLSSLVPTQVHDLVRAKLRSPASLRAVVIGGGALDPALYTSARELGWPLLPSYGLTECCSQVATADLRSLARLDFPALKVLSHAQIELRERRIFVRADSLCSLVARARRTGEVSLEDPLRAGWLPTEDLGEWQDKKLRVLGRRDDVVKILGVLVNVNQIEHEARAYFSDVDGDLTLLAVPGGREGHRLMLVTNSVVSLKVWMRKLEGFNATVQGPHRIRQLVWTPVIPRGELGKVKRASLLADLRLC